MDAREAPLDVKRLREVALRAAHGNTAFYTRFLEPSMADEARRAAAACGAKCAFWGGYAEAERTICAFYIDEPPEPGDYPIACVGLSWNGKFASPGHRDLLGAAMGLGLERDSVGDVALCAGGGCVFVHRDVADYVAANYVSAGRASVKAAVLAEVPAILPPEGSEIRVTVSATRLDAVLAAGYNLSRSEAQKMTEAGLVKRNHAVELRPDARVGAGDLISARGFGRLKVLSLEGETRRGRLALKLLRYGG